MPPACRSRSAARSRWSGRPGPGPLELVERASGPRRGGRTGCAAGRGRRCASSRFWRRWASHSSASGISSMRSQKRRAGAPGVDVIEIRAELCARGAPRSAGPTQVGVWTPLVMPEDRVRDDVTARWRWRSRRGAGSTALAPLGQPEQNAVMSNWPGRRPTPRPSSSRRSTGTPPVSGRPSPSSSGPGDRGGRGRRRSARCPPRPGCGS